MESHPSGYLLQVGVLNVVEAPDILYNETSNDTIVAEGASVTLRCEARGYPEPTVTWRREDGAPIVLRSHQTRSKSHANLATGYKELCHKLSKKALYTRHTRKLVQHHGCWTGGKGAIFDLLVLKGSSWDYSNF